VSASAGANNALAMEAGMAGLELHKSSSGSEFSLGDDKGDALLSSRESPVINLHSSLPM